MYVYSVVLGKTEIDPVLYELNMKQLLKDNEVLNFGFDDFNESFSCITVQAKNLHLYKIDFTNQKVIEVHSEMNSIKLQSIFYNFNDRDKNLSSFSEFKELIECEEQKGNQVLIPKLDADLLAIRQGSSNTVKLYSITLRAYFREIQIEIADVNLQDQIEK